MRIPLRIRITAVQSGRMYVFYGIAVYVQIKYKTGKQLPTTNLQRFCVYVYKKILKLQESRRIF
jgi:hypothetical protein